MKNLIIRADDVGYTISANDGTFRAIDAGIVTSADLMLDTPGALDAMTRLRERPWISVGWHTHFWGSPVLDPEEVPSLVNEAGRFKFRHDPKLKETVVYEEAAAEMRAQLLRCQHVMGRMPAYTDAHGDGVFEKALQDVCQEFHIPTHITYKPDRSGTIIPPDPKFQDLHIYMPNQPAGYYKVCYDESYAVRSTYDPVRYFIDDVDSLMSHETVLTAWHPGFLDDYILKESSLKEARVKDVQALTSPVLKQWIIDNGICLMNTTDALYGTHVYQDHLKKIGSSLCQISKK